MKLIMEIDEEQMVRNLYRDLCDLCDIGPYDVLEEDHENFCFLFRREEDGTEHRIDLPRAMDGFRRFAVAINRGELQDLCELCSDSLGNPKAWTCEHIDQLIQYTIDGKLIDP